MHYALLGFEVFKANAFSQVITFSFLENIWLIGIGFGLLGIEILLAHMVWRFVKRYRQNQLLYYMLSIFSGFIVISYSVNFLAKDNKPSAFFSENNRYFIGRMTHFIPYYNEIFSLLVPLNRHMQAIETAKGILLHFKLHKSDYPLTYPKHALQCQKTPKPLNIVVIAIDTWRYDTMNPTITPNIAEFAKNTLRFENHWSGGNCTKAGLFSLFYSLPANYWDSVYAQKKGPAFLQALINADYQMGIFASAQLNFPAFDKTIFRDIKSLKIFTKGTTTIERDQQVTKDFRQFIAARDKQRPFFSFLFYDAAHNYCESSPPKKQPFQPAVFVCNRFSLTKNSDPTTYMNRYRNAVHFIDNEVKKALMVLKQEHLLDNTIVIVTADHGEEINDKHSGYWQHASAYTAYQLHTPFLIYWPGKKAATYHHFTTHYDVVPTLMTSAINCKNPLADYTIGHSLFAQIKEPMLISGGYADYAIISKDQTLRIYEDGDYSLDDASGQPLQTLPKNINSLSAAFKLLNDYYAP